MKLSSTQTQALEILKAELDGDLLFGNKYFSTTLGRNISDATLQSLANKGLIRVLNVFTSTYTVKGNYGRSIGYKRQELCIQYQLVA